MNKTILNDVGDKMGGILHLFNRHIFYPQLEFYRAPFFSAAKTFEQVLFGGDHEGVGLVGVKGAGAFEGFASLMELNVL